MINEYCRTRLGVLACIFFDTFSFEFVKASGTEIVPVNVPEGQEMTGRILKHISSTGPVYIRPCNNMEVKLRFFIIYTSTGVTCYTVWD